MAKTKKAPSKKFSLQKLSFLYQHFLNGQLAIAIKKTWGTTHQENKKALLFSPLSFEQKLFLKTLKRLKFEVHVIASKEDVSTLPLKSFDLVVVSTIFEKASACKMTELFETFTQELIQHPTSFLVSPAGSSYQNQTFRFDRIFHPAFAKAI